MKYLSLASYMGRAGRMAVVALALVVLCLGSLSVPVLADTEVRLQSTLSPTQAGGKAKGTAEWRQQRNDKGAVIRTRLRVDVQDVSVNGTGQVVIIRNGARIFTAPIQIVNGAGRLELDSQNGQQVLTLLAGDRVEVSNRNGVVVLQGTLRRV